MFFQRQARLRMFLNSVLVIFTVLCVNISYAQQSGASASVNLRKLDSRAAVETYKTLSASAMRAFMKHLINPNDTEELEKEGDKILEIAISYVQDGTYPPDLSKDRKSCKKTCCCIVCA